MLTLEELFKRLSFVEFANLAIGGEGVGSIVEDARPRIAALADEALLRLHSRFLLRENVLFFQQVEHLTYYYMLKRYARSQAHDPPRDCDPPHLYILDHAQEPYDDDLIKILVVLDDYGCEIAINDAENPCSLFTPQPNLIQVPKPIDGKILSVSYQARHPKLVYDGKCRDLCTEIDVPYVLEGALQAYIAGMVYSSMNGQENALKAQEHMSRFEAVCTDVVTQDLVSQTTVTTNTKFDNRGFC